MLLWPNAVRSLVKNCRVSGNNPNFTLQVCQGTFSIPYSAPAKEGPNDILPFQRTPRRDTVYNSGLVAPRLVVFGFRVLSLAAKGGRADAIRRKLLM